MENNFEEIIYSSLSGEKLSGEEKKCLDQWLDDAENKKEYRRLEFLRNQSNLQIKINKIDDEKSWDSIESRLSVKIEPSFNYRRIIKYAAVIMLPILMSTAAFYIIRSKTEKQYAQQTNTIKPGTNKALLTLASGEEVALEEKSDDLILNKTGDTIAVRAKNGIVYDDKTSVNINEHNKVYVPRGGEFQLTLSDGTKVWLNSETELRYPVHFNGKERKVFLKGEAFFKVTHNKKKPFIVSSERQNVKVFGTSFNVKDYIDEYTVQTTLAEGSVKVYDKNSDQAQFIKPGEQAVICNNKLCVREVDVEEYISWKEGEFIFKHERLEEIMTKISRWYDVEIFYLNEEVKDYHFTAWFKKDKGINYVVKQLRATNRLDVRIKNRTIVISDKTR